MPKITLQQMSDITGITSGNLSNYRKRGKIVEDSEGLFNTENKFNKLFLDQKVLKKMNTSDASEPDDALDGIPDISVSTTRLKFLQANKTEKEIAKLELDIQKKQGEVIPYELIKPIFLQHNMSLLTAFKNAIEDVIRALSKENELNGEQIARVRGEVIEIINAALKNANDVSLKSIDIVISNYSDLKGIGEHG